jgi:hypothetical protein
MTLLVGPQLSAKCATDVMGWEIVAPEFAYTKCMASKVGTTLINFIGDDYLEPMTREKTGVAAGDVWMPHEDRNQAFEVALKAVEKAGEDTFVLQLDEVLNFPADDFGDTRIEFSYKGAWIFLSASPEQICNAALLAVENL